MKRILELIFILILLLSFSPSFVVAKEGQENRLETGENRRVTADSNISNLNIPSYISQVTQFVTYDLGQAQLNSNRLLLRGKVIN